MKELQTDFGRRLYEMLPAVYRSRDNGDLAGYLDGCGRLLDLVAQTLRQRLADAFPDHPPENQPACQEWLLPYFADLLDVRLVSPHARGRREEIGNAVAWRQRKGTAACIEQVAEAVAQMEVEIQEGWRRVAVTPRIGMPLPSARSLGYESEPEFDGRGLFAHPALGARHPGLPAATVDFRCPLRAVTAGPGNPAARTTRFGNHPVSWRQAGLHGAPCFPGSFEDVSRRTADIRTPDFCRGHHHPRRLLLFAPPPAGFFPAQEGPVELRMEGTAPFDYAPCRESRSACCGEFAAASPPEGVMTGDRGVLSIDTDDAGGVGIPVVVTRISGSVLGLKGPPPPEGLVVPVEPDRVRLRLQSTLTVRWSQRHESQFQELIEERVEIRRQESGNQDVRVIRNRTLGTDWFVPIRIIGRIDLDGGQTHRFEGLVLANTLAGPLARVELRETAAFQVEIQTEDIHRPVVDARDSLIRTLLTPGGLSRLEYCTVLDPIVSAAIEASDTIFMGTMRQGGLPIRPPSPACLRYSRFSREQITSGISAPHSNTDPVELVSAVFGERGCGVLHPATAASVRFGAEDGGEMGACHGRLHTLQTAAVLEKLKDFLPVGIEGVLITDTRLLEPPPPGADG
ncbi:MAG: phage tail protein [Desulfobacterales bacterium]